jgi:hypothetical protein
VNRGLIVCQCNDLAEKWDKSRDDKEPQGFSSDDVKDFSATQKGQS